MDQHDILTKHLDNQAASLKLQEKKLHLEMKRETKKAEKEQRDRIFDILKQRSELEKMGVSVAYIDKYFRLSPQGVAKNSATSSDDSSSISD